MYVHMYWTHIVDMRKEIELLLANLQIEYGFLIVTLGRLRECYHCFKTAETTIGALW